MQYLSLTLSANLTDELCYLLLMPTIWSGPIGHLDTFCRRGTLIPVILVIAQFDDVILELLFFYPRFFWLVLQFGALSLLIPFTLTPKFQVRGKVYQSLIILTPVFFICKDINFLYLKALQSAVLTSGVTRFENLLDYSFIVNCGGEYSLPNGPE